MIARKKHRKDSVGYIIFTIFNYIFLTLVALLCILPLVHILAISLSDKGPVEANIVGLWPKGFNFDSYKYVFATNQFWVSLRITVLRTVLGTILTLILTICLAYPLSRPARHFRGRAIYMTLMIIAMLFSGGLIPTYIIVTDVLKLKDSIASLILPCGIQIFSALMMMNFFRMLPRELEEAAYIDGADHFQTLFRVVLPCSFPIIITVVLFSVISHWNSWFDGLIYNTQPEYYPLQTYLQQFLKQPTNSSMEMKFNKISDSSLAAANIFIIMIPVLIFYPWMQKYFIKGITLGSVKE